MTSCLRRSASCWRDGCTALPFDPAHLRALMIGSAEIGEIVMRALILRRVGLIEQGGVKVNGEKPNFAQVLAPAAAEIGPRAIGAWRWPQTSG